MVELNKALGSCVSITGYIYPKQGSNGSEPQMNSYSCFFALGSSSGPPSPYRRAFCASGRQLTWALLQLTEHNSVRSASRTWGGDGRHWIPESLNFTDHRFQSAGPSQPEGLPWKQRCTCVSGRYCIKGEKIIQSSVQELHTTLLWRHHWIALFSTNSNICLLTQSMLCKRHPPMPSARKPQRDSFAVSQ